MDAPESLFYSIEQCQEIQVLAQDSYTNTQIINNTIRLLMQFSIFPLKEFNDWEAITPKMYPALKTFIAVAYTHQMLAMQLHNTAGKMGLQEEEDVAGQEGDAEQGEEVDDTSALHLPITCVCRCSK